MSVLSGNTLEAGVLYCRITLSLHIHLACCIKNASQAAVAGTSFVGIEYSNMLMHHVSTNHKTHNLQAVLGLAARMPAAKLAEPQATRKGKAKSWVGNWDWAFTVYVSPFQDTRDL